MTTPTCREYLQAVMSLRNATKTTTRHACASLLFINSVTPDVAAHERSGEVQRRTRQAREDLNTARCLTLSGHMEAPAASIKLLRAFSVHHPATTDRMIMNMPGWVAVDELCSRVQPDHACKACVTLRHHLNFREPKYQTVCGVHEVFSRNETILGNASCGVICLTCFASTYIQADLMRRAKIVRLY